MKPYNIVFLLVLSVIHTGCAAALVGGGAAGGYYVSEDERTLGTITDDAVITSKVNTRYAKDDLVSAIDVNVDTENGRVTLRGHVSSQAAHDRAISIARAVSGVRSVHSQLSIIK